MTRVSAASSALEHDVARGGPAEERPVGGLTVEDLPQVGEQRIKAAGHRRRLLDGLGPGQGFVAPGSRVTGDGKYLCPAHSGARLPNLGQKGEIVVGMLQDVRSEHPYDS
jgi:hypothetical protein